MQPEQTYLDYFIDGGPKGQLIIVGLETKTDAHLITTSLAYDPAVKGNKPALFRYVSMKPIDTISGVNSQIVEFDCNGEDLIELRNKIRKCIWNESPSAVFINCLSDISFTGRVDISDLRTIVGSLRLLARERNLPIILSTILNSRSYNHGHPIEERLGEINGLECIKDIADVVMLGFTDTSASDSFRELRIIKNRMGPTGSFKINIAGNHLKVDDRVFDRQTNQCYFSRMLAEYSYGTNLLGRLLNHNISVKFLDHTRDIWCRDYMPIQIRDNEYVGYDYVPDYLYNSRDYPYITNPARILHDLKIDVKPIGLILDGGNVIKTRKGVIMVDKVLKENDHLSDVEVIDRLEKAFDSEIILLPWDRVEEYGHADGIVREISNDKVLLTNYHQYSKEYAEKYMKILSKHFDVEVLDFKVKKTCRYSWCYINFLRIGNRIFLPQLKWEDYSSPSMDNYSPDKGNDKSKHQWYHGEIEEDSQAIDQFKKLFPTCEIIPVSCPHIVKQGGALNCISWNIKC